MNRTKLRIFMLCKWKQTKREGGKCTSLRISLCGCWVLIGITWKFPVDFFLTTSSAFEHCFDGLQYFIHAHCYTSDGLSSSLWSPERQLVPFSQSQWCGSFAPKVSSGARALTLLVIRISQTSLFLSPHHFSICRVTTEGDVTQNTTYFAQCFNLTSKQKANTQAETCQTCDVSRQHHPKLPTWILKDC